MFLFGYHIPFHNALKRYAKIITQYISYFNQFIFIRNLHFNVNACLFIYISIIKYYVSPNLLDSSIYVRENNFE